MSSQGSAVQASDAPRYSQIEIESPHNAQILTDLSNLSGNPFMVEAGYRQVESHPTDCEYSRTISQYEKVSVIFQTSRPIMEDAADWDSNVYLTYKNELVVTASTYGLLVAAVPQLLEILHKNRAEFVYRFIKDGQPQNWMCGAMGVRVPTKQST